jgi:hypothetical protein
MAAAWAQGDPLVVEAGAVGELDLFGGQRLATAGLGRERERVRADVPRGGAIDDAGFVAHRGDEGAIAAGEDAAGHPIGRLDHLGGGRCCEHEQQQNPHQSERII